MLDTPIEAFWLQDWVGNRQTVAGALLWWMWVLNENQYPQWPDLVPDLASSGIRVMAYISPFFLDLSEELSYDGGEVLSSEAPAAEYFVENADGETILVTYTDFSAGSNS
jgi:alpha-glucosidase (family GH31 glycosyl hydrolase)